MPNSISSHRKYRKNEMWSVVSIFVLFVKYMVAIQNDWIEQHSNHSNKNVEKIWYIWMECIQSEIRAFDMFEAKLLLASWLVGWVIWKKSVILLFE